LISKGSIYDRTHLYEALDVDIEEWKLEVMAQDKLFIKLHDGLLLELHFQRELLISRF